MKIVDLKTFVVGNPPPGFGGRYFLFVKLVTDDGIEGVGEVYADTFGAHTMARMVADVFERHVLGMDPFHIEALWRKVYGTGYTLRPDVSLMGVLSGIEIALWDIVGKATGKPVYELLGGKVHERLRSYTYIYPEGDETAAIYHDAELSAQRAAQYVKQGFTAVKFDPAAPYSVFDPRQPSLESIALCEKFVPPDPRGRRHQGRSAVRHPRPVHRLRRHPPSQAARALRSPVVRGADAAGDAGGNGAGGARHLDPRRDRRTSHHQVRILPRARAARRLDPADGARPRRRPARGQEDRRHGRGALRADCPHLYCGPVEGAANVQLAACSPNFLILESIQTWGGFHAKILKKPMRWEEGYVIPSSEPGLGIELDEAVALAHPYTGKEVHLEMTERPIE